MHASSVLAAGSPQRRPEGWRPSSQSCPGRMPTAWHLGESEPVTAVRIGTIGGRVRRLAHILSRASPRTGWSTWPPGALEHEALVRFRAGAVSDRSRQAAPLTWACHGRWQVAGSATRRPACCLPGSGPGRRLARWVRKVTAAPGRHGHEHRSRCSPRARRQHGVPYGARRHFEGFFAVPCRPPARARSGLPRPVPDWCRSDVRAKYSLCGVDRPGQWSVGEALWGRLALWNLPPARVPGMERCPVMDRPRVGSMSALLPGCRPNCCMRRRCS